MATQQIATHVKVPSTPSKQISDTSAVLFTRDYVFSNRPSSSDGAAATKASPLTRPKFRRRGQSATSPASSEPKNNHQATPNLRPKTSPTISPNQHSNIPPALSFAAISALSPAQTSHLSSETRSPHSNKRPPASRSCHGIATSNGPPPAISTQRAYSYSSEHPCKSQPNKEAFSVEHPKLTPHALAQLDAANSSPTNLISPKPHTEPKKADEKVLIETIESPEAKTEVMVTTATQSQPEPVKDMERKRYSADVSKRASQRLSARLNDAGPTMREDRSEKSSQEDLFLNMAQDDGGDDETLHGNHEQRRVSYGYESLSLDAIGF